MYLRKYFQERIQTWFLDKKEDRYSQLDNFPFYVNKHYIDNALNENIVSQFFSSDLLNNTITVQLSDFDNIFVKIIDDCHIIYIELYTIIDDEEVTILTKDKINHKLFYELITKQFQSYKYLYNLKTKLEKKSKWAIRQQNYETLYFFVKIFINLNINTFQSKQTINIRFDDLKQYSSKSIKELFLNKVLFFKSLKDDSLVHLLNNYSIISGTRPSDFNVNFNDIQRVVENHTICEIFEKYSITHKHIDYLHEFNKKDVIRTVIDYTEASFNIENHHDSFYYQLLKSRIENKNIYTYFMFLRLAFFGKLHLIPEEMIESLNQDFLEEFDNLTVILLEICNNVDLQYSFIQINDMSGKIEFNEDMINYEYDHITKMLYQLIKSAPDKISPKPLNYIREIVLELINSSVFQVNSMAEVSDIINKFNTFHNLKKIQFKYKLEKKLVSKSVVKKEKVKKI